MTELKKLIILSSLAYLVMIAFGLAMYVGDEVIYKYVILFRDSHPHSVLLFALTYLAMFLLLSVVAMTTILKLGSLFFKTPK